MKSLHECLNHIQINLNAPKNLHNSFGNYKYRNLDGILKALKPLLKETGCIFTITDSIEMVGERYYIKAVATLSKGEERMSVEGWARETESRKGMDDSQCTGSTSTYARKFACNGLFGISDEQDPDSMDNRNTITDKQKEKYQSIIQSGYFEGQKSSLNKWWKAFTTKQQAEAGLESLEKRLEEKQIKEKEKENV